MNGNTPFAFSPARHFQPSPSFRLQCWLEEHGLGHYYDNLRRCDVTELCQLERLQLEASVFTELEMDVPGHRKRFTKAGRFIQGILERSLFCSIKSDRNATKKYPAI